MMHVMLGDGVELGQLTRNVLNYIIMVTRRMKMISCIFII